MKQTKKCNVTSLYNSNGFPIIASLHLVIFTLFPLKNSQNDVSPAIEKQMVLVTFLSQFGPFLLRIFRLMSHNDYFFPLILHLPFLFPPHN